MDDHLCSGKNGDNTWNDFGFQGPNRDIRCSFPTGHVHKLNEMLEQKS